MTKRLEPLPRDQAYPDTAYSPPWHQSPKVKLFTVTFGITLLLGLAWTLLQPTIYRSSATVLMSALSAIDAQAVEADTQNVAIQRRILLGSEITSQTLQALNTRHHYQLEVASLRDVLQVEAVPDTNLVEMVAQGAEQALLPILVNSWIDVYIDARATDIAQSRGRTTQIVQDELDGLAIKLTDTRQSLEVFRDEHNIISAERQENDVLARLEGLNTALNNAIEVEVQVSAYLETIQDAIQNREKVVPKEELNALQRLETELQALQAQMLELRNRYTEQYINKQPAMRSTLERIEALKQEISSLLTEGQKVELAAARQAHTTARKTVEELERQLAEHKQKVAAFSSIFATHEALVTDLEGLEELNRETQARLVQIEISRVEKYPQVAVISRPESTAERIGPDYLLILGMVLGASLGTGVLAVWLYGFLGHNKQQPAYVTLTGVHMYQPENNVALADGTNVDNRLTEKSPPRIEGD